MKEKIPEALVRDYLLGKLSPADLEDFYTRLGTDPALARELDWQRAEMAVSETLIASEIRNMFEEWRTAASSPPGRFNVKPLWWIGGIAAGLVIAWLAIEFYYPVTPPPPVLVEKPLPPPQIPDTAQPEKREAADPAGKIPLSTPARNYRSLAAQWLPEPMLSNLRQISSDSTGGAFRQAQETYRSGDYRKTLQLLAQADSTRWQSSAFLSAYALFHLNRFREAEARFAELVARDSRRFRYDSEWGVLMCRLAEFPGREKEVRQQLNQILDKPEHPYFDRGKLLEKALKE
jgi:hypothetical protein